MKPPLLQSRDPNGLSRHTPPIKVAGMDSPFEIADALGASASLAETVDPLFRTIGGGASFGIAVLCAWEASRKEPRWDRAAGIGAALGAVAEGAVLLYDIVHAC
jgi:hypothetical protein